MWDDDKAWEALCFVLGMAVAVTILVFQ